MTCTMPRRTGLPRLAAELAAAASGTGVAAPHHSLRGMARHQAVSAHLRRLLAKVVPAGHAIEGTHPGRWPHTLHLRADPVPCLTQPAALTKEGDTDADLLWMAPACPMSLQATTRDTRTLTRHHLLPGTGAELVRMVVDSTTAIPTVMSHTAASLAMRSAVKAPAKGHGSLAVGQWVWGLPFHAHSMLTANHLASTWRRAGCPDAGTERVGRVATQGTATHSEVAAALRHPTGWMAARRALRELHNAVSAGGGHEALWRA